MELCKNFKICQGEKTGCGGCRLCPGDLCMNCNRMFNKSLKFIDTIECPVCYETTEGVIQVNCEHSICIECFKKCYYGIYKETNFPYSSDIEKEYEEYESFDHIPKTFLDKYPRIEEYEKECNRQYDEQEKMQKCNGKCPICRQ